MIQKNPKLNLVLFIILALFLAALISRNPALIWMDLPFLFYLGAGLLSSPGQVILHASRAINQTRCEPGIPITLTLTLENDGASIPRLQIQEQSQPQMQMINGSLNQRFGLPTGEKANLHYTFQARRGIYRWDTIQVTASDPFGLFNKNLELAAPAQVRIIPEPLNTRQLHLQPKQTLHTTGLNLSRLPGSGVDFFDVREYRTGDSLRQVQWRLSARHPNKFFTKEFEREEMADFGLILDGSAANFNNGMEDLFEYSVQAAAGLAKNLLRMGNRVSLLALCDKVVRVFPGTGKHQLFRILDQLAGCVPGEKVSLETLKYLPVRLFPSHSLIIIISPLRARDVPSIARLRAEGYQVLLVSPNPVQFASQGSHHSLAVRAAELERNTLIWRIREIGVQVIDWSVGQPLIEDMGMRHWIQR